MAGKTPDVKEVAEQAKAAVQAVPWWGQVIVGALGGILIFKYTPILEILTLFFYIVCIPFLLMCCFGLVSNGTMNAILGGWQSTKEAIKQSVDEKVKASAA